MRIAILGGWIRILLGYFVLRGGNRRRGLGDGLWMNLDALLGFV